MNAMRDKTGDSQGLWSKTLDVEAVVTSEVSVWCFSWRAAPSAETAGMVAVGRRSSGQWAWRTCDKSALAHFG